MRRAGVWGILLLGLATANFLSAQPIPDEAINAERGTLVIRSISWDIEGRVGKSYVANVADFQAGKSFKDKAALDAYLDDRAQRLFNLRLFDTIDISTKSDSTEVGGQEAVDLVVHLRESGTLIVLPGVTDNGTDGFVTNAELLLYDFGGCGAEFDAGVSRAWPPGDIGETSGTVSYKAPFYSGPLEWDVALSGSPTVDDGGNCSFATIATAGLDWALFEKGGAHQVLLIPSIAASADWGGSNSSAISPGLGLRLGRIDWILNRRRGYLVEFGIVGEGTGFGTASLQMLPSYSMDANLHALVGAGGELMGKAGILWSPEAADCGLGTMVRGVAARRLVGYAGIYENMDFWWNLGPFVFSKWFGMRWLRIFDAEVHAGPFIDIGLARDSSSGGLDFGNDRIGAGLQIQSYALYARPFYLYTSIGVDLRAACASGTVFGVAADGLPIAILTSAIGLRY
jgi:hypothetical protein